MSTIVTTEDGQTFTLPEPIRQGLTIPLQPTAPCLGRHADTLSAPLSVVGTALTIPFSAPVYKIAWGDCNHREGRECRNCR